MFGEVLNLFQESADPSEFLESLGIGIREFYYEG